MPNLLRSLILGLLRREDYPVERDYRLVAKKEIPPGAILARDMFQLEHIEEPNADEDKPAGEAEANPPDDR